VDVEVDAAQGVHLGGAGAVDAGQVPQAQHGVLP
jgi:hypothetical protein